MPETKKGIVATIMAFLKLDDEGKLGKFFAKEVKKFETAIRDLNNNKVAIANVYNSNLEKLNDKLDDAKDSVEAAYQSVTPEDIVNNEQMEKFAVKYWRNITNAEQKVTSLNEELKESALENKKTLEDLDEQIAKYQARIDKINSY